MIDQSIKDQRMPQRTEHRYDDRRQQIMDGALHVFASKGFERATNKDIAAAAGIGSPGLIYHYFKDKADLLREVIEKRVPLLQLIAHPEELMSLPPAEALAHFGRTYLKLMESRESAALLKLIMGEVVRHPRMAQLFAEIGPNRALRFLERYLEQQMLSGTLRHVDPVLAARSFMGPLILFVLTREILQQPEAMGMDPETVVQTTVDLFLGGVQNSQ